MEMVIFILLLAIGVSTGKLLDQCDVYKCKNMIIEEDFEDVDVLPTESDLKKLCPPVLEILDCATDLIPECTGFTFEELALKVQDNETLSMILTIFSGIKSVSTDLCDEDSLLHKNYVSSISCFRDTFATAGEKCITDGKRLYGSYRGLLLEDDLVEDQSENDLVEDQSENDYDYNINGEAECLVVGYGIACLSLELRETCGVTASETFVDIIRRLKFLKLAACSPEDALTLKTEFLNYLDEQGKERDFFASVFEFRRK